MAKINEPHSPEKLNRIVAGTQIEGVIVSDSNIRIDGSVNGTITVKGRLVVGSTGKIKGEVECENADIEGNIEGKIAVNGLLSLKSTARLECDITTKKLAIEPGATFSGNCSMSGGASKDLNQTQPRASEPREQKETGQQREPLHPEKITPRGPQR